MSCNISKVHVVSGGHLRIASLDLLSLLRKRPEWEWVPDQNLIDEAVKNEPDENGEIELREFLWHGECSGNGYEDVLIKQILPLTKGSIDLVFIWEDGDSVSGLQVRDGVATECTVDFVLTPATDPVTAEVDAAVKANFDAAAYEHLRQVSKEMRDVASDFSCEFERWRSGVHGSSEMVLLNHRMQEALEKLDAILIK